MDTIEKDYFANDSLLEKLFSDGEKIEKKDDFKELISQINPEEDVLAISYVIDKERKYIVINTEKEWQQQQTIIKSDKDITCNYSCIKKSDLFNTKQGQNILNLTDEKDKQRFNSAILEIISVANKEGKAILSEEEQESFFKKIEEQSKLLEIPSTKFETTTNKKLKKITFKALEEQLQHDEVVIALFRGSKNEKTIHFMAIITNESELNEYITTKKPKGFRLQGFYAVKKDYLEKEFKKT